METGNGERADVKEADRGDRIMDLERIRDALSGIFCEYGVRRAVLFGSYVTGKATEESDIDLFVDSGLKGLKFVGLMEAIREALGGKKLDLIDQSHVEKGSRIEQEIMRTGIVVYER